MSEFHPFCTGICFHKVLKSANYADYFDRNQVLKKKHWKRILINLVASVMLVCSVTKFIVWQICSYKWAFVCHTCDNEILLCLMIKNYLDPNQTFTFNIALSSNFFTLKWQIQSHCIATVVLHLRKCGGLPNHTKYNFLHIVALFII